MDDMISRRAAIDAICEDGTQRERQGQYSMTMVDRKYRDIEILEALSPAQPECEDCIKHGGNICPPCPKVPECEDAVPRTSVEYICRKNTVSTNPYEHKYHDKFMQFMDDPEISDFGRWQHSNGFNTALVAVKCDLDKVPPAQQKKLKYSGESICIHCQTKDCDGCLFEPMEGVTSE